MIEWMKRSISDWKRRKLWNRKRPRKFSYHKAIALNQLLGHTTYTVYTIHKHVHHTIFITLQFSYFDVFSTVTIIYLYVHFIVLYVCDDAKHLFSLFSCHFFFFFASSISTIWWTLNMYVYVYFDVNMIGQFRTPI